MWAVLAVLVLIHFVLVLGEFSLLKLRYAGLSPLSMARLRNRGLVARMLDESPMIARFIRFGLTAITLAMGILLYPCLDALIQKLFARGPRSFGSWVFYLLTFSS